MTYEVQTLTCFNRWENTWTEDGNILVTFETLEDAQKELAGFLEDLDHFVKIGHLQDHNPEDYRIKEITA